MRCVRGGAGEEKRNQCNFAENSTPEIINVNTYCMITRIDRCQDGYEKGVEAEMSSILESKLACEVSGEAGKK